MRKSATLIAPLLVAAALAYFHEQRMRTQPTQAQPPAASAAEATHESRALIGAAAAELPPVPDAGVSATANDHLAPTHEEPELVPAWEGVKLLSTIRADFEREPRDETAPAAEALIREHFDAEPRSEGVLRTVRCHQSVCKIDARWSREVNQPYNAALVNVVKSLTTEISFDPGGPPDGTSVPMTIYVRRKQAPAE